MKKTTLASLVKGDIFTYNQDLKNREAFEVVRIVDENTIEVISRNVRRHELNYKKIKVTDRDVFFLRNLNN